MNSENNIREQIILASQAIENLAFEMKAPNSYTPRFVMIAIALRKLAQTTDLDEDQLTTT